MIPHDPVVLGLCPASLTRVGCGPDETDAEEEDNVVGCWCCPVGNPGVVVAAAADAGGTARANCWPCRNADELTDIPEYTDDPSLLLLTVLLPAPPPAPAPDRLDSSAPALALADVVVTVACAAAAASCGSVEGRWYWCDEVDEADPRGDDVWCWCLVDRTLAPAMLLLLVVIVAEGEECDDDEDGCG
jgi:hypothetical protein